MNSTILKKVALLTLTGLVLLAIVEVAAWIEFKHVAANQSATMVASEALRDHMEADMMHDALRADVLSALHAAAVKDVSAIAVVRKEVAEHAKHLRDSLEANKVRGLSPKAATAMSLTAKTVEDYVTSAETMVKLAEADAKAAEAQLPAFASTFTELEGKLGAVSDAVEADNKTIEQESHVAIAQFKMVLLISAGVGSVTLLTIGFLVSRSIPRPFQQIVTQLSQATLAINDRAAEVAQVNQSLAQGASEQAASIEETSASLEEISSMTRRNVENVQNAKDFTAQTRATAASGAQSTQEMGQAMQGIRSASSEMRDAMNAIKAASNDVSKIIKTIDEIAFQTNLLALNAAVEAARAGEAGMGFAVVADEVRSLAQRSAKAAKETADMIETSVKRSEDGVRVTEKVTVAVQEVAAKSAQLEAQLAEIVAKAQKVDEQVAQIASASQEQSQGISEVNMAVSQMDKVTQSTASNAEESAAAAEELNAQTQLLRGAISELQTLVSGKAAELAAPSQVASRPKAKISRVRSKSTAPAKFAREADNLDIPMPEPIGAGQVMDGFKDF